MSPKLRVYYNAVVGGLAGLITWLVVGQLFGSEARVQVRNLFSGATTGLIIGLAIGSLDGVFSRSTKRALAGALAGAIFGLVGGVTSLWLAEATFGVVKGGLLGRAFGWAIFGIGIGLGESLLARSARRTSYSVLGGFVGGFAGGLVLQVLFQARFDLTLATALARVILGACIGSFIGLAQEFLKQAWVTVVRGRPEGHESILYRIDNTVGSSEQSDVMLHGDWVPHHAARIVQQKGQFFLDPLGNQMTVNQAPVRGRISLKDSDRIEIGKSALVFRTKVGAR